MSIDWKDTLDDGSLSFREADPGDERLDSFDCGDTAPALEVNDYFRHRKWMKQDKKGRPLPSPPAFQFGHGEEVIGYAAIAHANRRHPTEGSDTRKRYLVIFVTGVDGPYQGRQNPRSSKGERYAENLFRALEEKFAPSRPGCVGLYLMVREDNTRAIHFYERVGFGVDPLPEGRLQPDWSPAPLLVMRKVFPEQT